MSLLAKTSPSHLYPASTTHLYLLLYALQDLPILHLLLLLQLLYLPLYLLCSTQVPGRLVLCFRLRHWPYFLQVRVLLWICPEVAFADKVGGLAYVTDAFGS